MTAFSANSNPEEECKNHSMNRVLFLQLNILRSCRTWPTKQAQSYLRKVIKCGISHEYGSTTLNLTAPRTFTLRSRAPGAITSTLLRTHLLRGRLRPVLIFGRPRMESINTIRHEFSKFNWKIIVFEWMAHLAHIAQLGTERLWKARRGRARWRRFPLGPCFWVLALDWTPPGCDMCAKKHRQRQEQIGEEECGAARMIVTGPGATKGLNNGNLIDQQEPKMTTSVFPRCMQKFYEKYWI